MARRSNALAKQEPKLSGNGIGSVPRKNRRREFAVGCHLERYSAITLTNRNRRTTLRRHGNLATFGKPAVKLRRIDELMSDVFAWIKPAYQQLGSVRNPPERKLSVAVISSRSVDMVSMVARSCVRFALKTCTVSPPSTKSGATKLGQKAANSRAALTISRLCGSIFSSICGW
jgi:hypothetical protein